MTGLPQSPGLTPDVCQRARAAAVILPWVTAAVAKGPSGRVLGNQAAALERRDRLLCEVKQPLS
mgnify:CR=1 FL=1|jgi:hypothetical protein